MKITARKFLYITRRYEINVYTQVKAFVKFICISKFRAALFIRIFSSITTQLYFRNQV